MKVNKISIGRLLDDPIVLDLANKCSKDVKQSANQVIQLCESRESVVAVLIIGAITLLEGIVHYSAGPHTDPKSEKDITEAALRYIRYALPVWRQMAKGELE